MFYVMDHGHIFIIIAGKIAQLVFPGKREQYNQIVTNKLNIDIFKL